MDKPQRSVPAAEITEEQLAALAADVEAVHLLVNGEPCDCIARKVRDLIAKEGPEAQVPLFGGERAAFVETMYEHLAGATEQEEGVAEAYLNPATKLGEVQS